MAAVDFDLRFTYVIVVEGSAHYALILAHALEVRLPWKMKELTLSTVSRSLQFSVVELIIEVLNVVWSTLL
jgi:hypothetical protein